RPQVTAGSGVENGRPGRGRVELITPVQLVLVNGRTTAAAAPRDVAGCVPELGAGRGEGHRLAHPAHPDRVVGCRRRAAGAVGQALPKLAAVRFPEGDQASAVVIDG